MIGPSLEAPDARCAGHSGISPFDPTRNKFRRSLSLAIPLSLLSRNALSARRRALSPHPQVNDYFYCRREDQRAKRRLRDRLHRALDEDGMDRAPDDDDNREQRMGDAPRSQSQSPAESSQKRHGEDGPHGDHAKGRERRRR